MNRIVFVGTKEEVFEYLLGYCENVKVFEYEESFVVTEEN